MLVDDEAKLIGGQTVSSNRALGTPGYMCPAYLSSTRFSVKSEVYAYGIFLLELLTGRVQGNENAGDGLVSQLCRECNGSPGLCAIFSAVPGSVERGKAWIDTNIDRERISVFPYSSSSSTASSSTLPNFQDMLEKLVVDCLDTNPESRPLIMDCMRIK